jgi:hypothetical protein
MIGHDYFYHSQKAARQKGRCRRRRAGNAANPASWQRCARCCGAIHATDAVCQKEANLGLVFCANTRYEYFMGRLLRRGTLPLKHSG